MRLGRTSGDEGELLDGTSRMKVSWTAPAEMKARWTGPAEMKESWTGPAEMKESLPSKDRQAEPLK